MQADLISIIIPNYNRGELLIEAIRSCYEQKGIHFEVIVVDDGSEDGSGERAKHVFPSIKLVHQDHAGACAARNRGLDEARGAYVKFLDSDDKLGPDVLLKQYNFLTANSVDAVYGYFEMIGDLKDNRAKNGPYSGKGPVEDMFVSLMASWWCPPFCFLFKRSAIEKTSWREDLTCAQDTDFLLSLAIRDTSFAYLPIKAGYYRLHAQQITQLSKLEYAKNWEKMLENAELKLKEQNNINRRHIKALAHGYWWIARMYYRFDRPRFKTTVDKVFRLVPNFKPEHRGHWILLKMTRLIGIRNTEFMVSLWHKFKMNPS